MKCLSAFDLGVQFCAKYHYVKKCNLKFDMYLLFVAYVSKGQNIKKNVQLTATLYDLLRLSGCISVQKATVA